MDILAYRKGIFSVVSFAQPGSQEFEIVVGKLTDYTSGKPEKLCPTMVLTAVKSMIGSGSRVNGYAHQIKHGDDLGFIIPLEKIPYPAFATLSEFKAAIAEKAIA